ncbi:hypothetical protein [Vibrio cholerae]|uniref:hypothetical protein n=1 Tax=Vibrio cholerae TaxID=666 RepID=UPI003109DE7E|nr:hypothetical protein [Vibrio cholerae]EJH4017399.1 hypothetical protein [Vibrio cholerae]EJL6579361.1 hypothetical protein [Vibrio cholerae]EKF9470660.1 hypothetical protein [Vibrio cholerae]HDL9432232.1 hypothetical protein [Vibrio cholerae]
MEKSNEKVQLLVNAIRFRKPYTANDFQVTASELKVKKESYHLSKIKSIELKRLGFKDNVVKVTTYAILLSAATWAFVPEFGFFVLLIALILALVSMRKYELKVEFKGTDETGDYWVSIARCWTEDEFHILENIYTELKSRI